MKISKIFIGCAVFLSASPSHAAETVTYTYDANGRLIAVKRVGTINNNIVTTYQIDKADNRKNTSTTGSPNAPQP